MPVSYAASVGQDFDPDPSEPVLETLFKQYEKVLLTSLVISFGLDFLIEDHPGSNTNNLQNASNSRDSSKRKINPCLEISGRKLPNFRGNLRAGGNGAGSFRKENLSHNFGMWLNKSALQREQELRQLYFNPKLERINKEHKLFHKLEERNEINADAMKGMDVTAGSSYRTGMAGNRTRTKILKDTAGVARAGVSVGLRQAAGVIFLEMWIGVREEFLKFREDDDFAPQGFA